jgi:hypothetical protein
MKESKQEKRLMTTREKERRFRNKEEGKIYRDR